MNKRKILDYIFYVIGGIGLFLFFIYMLMNKMERELIYFSLMVLISTTWILLSNIFDIIKKLFIKKKRHP